jgi:hypothetical protein
LPPHAHAPRHAHSTTATHARTHARTQRQQTQSHSPPPHRPYKSAGCHPVQDAVARQSMQRGRWDAAATGSRAKGRRQKGGAGGKPNAVHEARRTTAGVTRLLPGPSRVRSGGTGSMRPGQHALQHAHSKSTQTIAGGCEHAGQPRRSTQALNPDAPSRGQKPLLPVAAAASGQRGTERRVGSSQAPHSAQRTRAACAAVELTCPTTPLCAARGV